MKKISNNFYDFNSSLSFDEITSRLHDIVLKKEILIMERTRKDFIGKVQGNSFSVIDSWFPIGAACVIKGEVTKDEFTQVNLTTSLHQAFRILFVVWTILMAGLIIVGLISSDNQEFSILPLFVLLIMIAIFRLFLHGIYVLARNRAVMKLKRILS